MTRVSGSSPHTRGARGLCLLCGCHDGIIPAYAGSTRRGSRSFRVFRDHPRIRGEHQWADAVQDEDEGSSPHTRGARATGRVSCSHPGIIPAYAGSTSARPAGTPQRRDHPRIRGEHTTDTMEDDDMQGSSPHTRGARQNDRDKGIWTGIIPAYAGSTPARMA